MDWIDFARKWDRWRAFVNAAMNLRVPYNAGNFLISWGTVTFSRRNLLPGVIIFNNNDNNNNKQLFGMSGTWAETWPYFPVISVRALIWIYPVWMHIPRHIGEEAKLTSSLCIPHKPATIIQYLRHCFKFFYHIIQLTALKHRRIAVFYNYVASYCQ